MSHQPPEDRLHRSLTSLPRERARERFTEEVLERLESRPARARSPRHGLLLAAGAAALLLALAFGLLTGRAPLARAATDELAAAQGQLDSLREDHLRLTREIEALQELALSEAPVIYLDGDETVDLIFDPRPARAGTVQPAVYGRRD